MSRANVTPAQLENYEIQACAITDAENVTDQQNAALTASRKVYAERISILEDHCQSLNVGFLISMGLESANFDRIGPYIPFIRGVLLTKAQIYSLSNNTSVSYMSYTGYTSVMDMSSVEDTSYSTKVVFMNKKRNKYIVLLIFLLCAFCFLNGCQTQAPETSTGSSAPRTDESTSAGGSTSETETTQAPPVTLYDPPEWDKIYHVIPYEEYIHIYEPDGEPAKHPGSVLMGEGLCWVLSHGMDAEQVYAIMPRYYIPNVSSAKFYEDVIVPLGVEEAFLEEQVIYVTQEQLLSLEWPDEYTIVLFKSVDPGAFDITVENLESCTEDRVPVLIKLAFPTAHAPQDSEDEWARIGETYGVVIRRDEEDLDVGFSSVPPQTLIEMLDDEMIGEILHQGLFGDAFFTLDM